MTTPIKFTLYTATFNERDKKAVREELAKGHLVCVSPTNVNRGKAQIIKEMAEQFFESLGAKLKEEVIIESNRYYSLNKKKGD